jgi:hypothetical protein
MACMIIVNALYSERSLLVGSTNNSSRVNPESNRFITHQHEDDCQNMKSLFITVFSIVSAMALLAEFERGMSCAPP